MKMTVSLSLLLTSILHDSLLQWNIGKGCFLAGLDGLCSDFPFFQPLFILFPFHYYYSHMSATDSAFASQTPMNVSPGVFKKSFLPLPILISYPLCMCVCLCARHCRGSVPHQLPSHCSRGEAPAPIRVVCLWPGRLALHCRECAFVFPKDTTKIHTHTHTHTRKEFIEFLTNSTIKHSLTFTHSLTHFHSLTHSLTHSLSLAQESEFPLGTFCNEPWGNLFARTGLCESDLWAPGEIKCAANARLFPAAHMGTEVSVLDVLWLQDAKFDKLAQAIQVQTWRVSWRVSLASIIASVDVAAEFAWREALRDQISYLKIEKILLYPHEQVSGCVCVCVRARACVCVCVCVRVCVEIFWGDFLVCQRSTTQNITERPLFRVRAAHAARAGRCGQDRDLPSA